MPAFPTIIIPLQALGNQPINAILQLGQAVTTTNIKITGMNRALQSTNTAAQGLKRSTAAFASSVGAFYLLNKASQLSTSMMREGIRAAADLQLAVNELGVTSGATGDQMEYFRGQALRLSSALGPLSAIDVTKGLTSLSRMVGPGQQRIVADFADELANFQNAMVLASGGKISAEAAAEAAKTTMSAFGGFKSGTPEDMQRMTDVLEYLFKVVARYSGGNLPQIQRAVNVVAPGMVGMGFAPKDIFAMAAFRTMFPTGGLRASGSDIRAMLEQFLSVGVDVKKGSKKSQAAHMEAFSNLGMITPQGRPVIIDPRTNRPDALRALTSMTRAIEQMRKKYPTDFPMKITQFLETAFSRDIAKRLASVFVEPGGLANLRAILERLEHGASMRDITREFEKGFHGAMERLTSNWENILEEGFRGPIFIIAPLLDLVAKGLEALTNVMFRNQTAASAGGLAVMGLGVAGGVGALSTMFLGASHALKAAEGASLIQRLIPATLGYLGRFGAVVALGAAIAAIIGGAILLGAYFYETNPTVHNAMGAVKEAVKRVLQKMIPSPEEIEKGQVQTHQYKLKLGELDLINFDDIDYYFFVTVPYKMFEAFQQWQANQTWIRNIIDGTVKMFDQMWSQIKANVDLFLFGLNPAHFYGSAAYMAEYERLGFGIQQGPQPPPPDVAATAAAMAAGAASAATSAVDAVGAGIGAAGTAASTVHVETQTYTPGKGGPLWRTSQNIWAKPAKPVTETDLEERERKFSKARAQDAGEGTYTDVPPGGVREGNSNAKVAANRSQVETYLSNMMDKIVTQQAGGMARTGTINRGLMPLRAR